MGKSTLFLGRPVRRGLLSTLFTAVLLILISALMFHFTPISEAFLPLTSLFILAFSAFAGGFVGARDAGMRGMLHGMTTGFLFFILVVVLAIFVAPESFAIFHILKKVLACVIGGALGGILGVSVS